MKKRVMGCMVGLVVMLAIVQFSGSLALSPMKSILLDNMENPASWTLMGMSDKLSVSENCKEGRGALAVSKAKPGEDWLRVIRQFDKEMDLSGYEKVSYWVYVPQPEIIKQVSVWLGERDRWTGGFIAFQSNFEKGWNHVQHYLFQTSPQGASLDTWKKVKVVSFEVTTRTAQQTYEGILFDDLRVWPESNPRKGPSGRPRNEPPCLQVGGKPFFPVGFYSVSNDTTDEEWEELRENGFNMATCAEGHYFNERVMKGDLAPWKEFLDKAHRHEIKVVVGLSAGEWTLRNNHAHIWWAADLNPDEVVFKCLKALGRSEEDARYCANRERSINYLKTVIPALKDHPALLCWESLDEIAQYGIPVEGLIEGVKLIKELDPGHPFWLNHPSSVIDPRGLRHYGQMADVVSMDIYPIPKIFGYGGLPNKDINVIGEYTDLLRESVYDEKPAWMVLQAYRFNDDEWASIKGEGIRRFPTLQEARFMTYQAIIHGAKGIVYFLYLPRKTPVTAHSHINTPFTPEFWTALKSIGRELKALQPALVAESTAGVVAVQPEGSSVRCMLKALQEESYLLAANEKGEPANVKFTLARGVKAVEPMFEDRTIELKENSFADEFEPLGIHVYRLK